MYILLTVIYNLNKLGYLRINNLKTQSPDRSDSTVIKFFKKPTETYNAVLNVKIGYPLSLHPLGM